MKNKNNKRASKKKKTTFKKTIQIKGRGFTLVELLAAITIMGIILIMAMPSIGYIQSRNEKQRYEKYASTLESAGKLYTDSNAIDMFGYNGVGCYDIPFEALKDKKLISDIEYKNITCADSSKSRTFVRVKKYQDTYDYQVSIYCADGRNNEVYSNLIGSDAICTEETSTEGPTITLTPTGTKPNNDPKYQVNIKIEDQDGLLENSIVEYAWSTNKDTNNGTYQKVYFKNKRNDKRTSHRVTRPAKDGTYYLFVKPVAVADVFNNQNIDTVKTGPYVFDTVPPNCPTITTSIADNKWTNQSIKFTFKFTSDTVKYNWYTNTDGGSYKDFGSNNASVTTKTLSGEGTRQVKVRVYDEAGNYSECINSSKKYLIDLTKPTCTSSGGSTSWTNGSRTLTGTCHDTGGSGCVGNATKNYTTEINSSKESPGTVYDHAGNSKACDANQTVKIDKTAPTSPSITNPTGGGWTKDNFQLKVSAKDNRSSINSGIHHWAYSYDNSNYTDYPSSATENFTTTPFSEERERQVYIRVCDNAGNCSTNSTWIRIDKHAPSCSINLSGTAGSNGWYKSNVGVNMTPSDNASGVSSYGLTTSTSATYNSSKSASQGDTTGVTWYGYVKDNAGNANKCSKNFKVDSTPPATPSINNPSGGNWYKSNLKLTLSSSDATSKVASWAYSTNNSSYTAYSSSNVNSYSPAQFTNEMDQTYYFRVCDYAGNCSYNNTKVRIDKTAPSCNISLSGTSGSNGWYKSNVGVSMSPTDGRSGVAAYGLTTSTSTTYNNSKSATQGETTSATWHGYVKDNAGNTNNCSKSLKVDTTPPKTPDIYNPSGGNWTRGPFALTVSSSDATSKIAYWAYSYDNANFTPYSNSATERFTTTNYSADRENISYTRVCDYAGNCSTNSTWIRIDTTPPTPRITYKHNETGCPDRPGTVYSSKIIFSASDVSATGSGSGLDTGEYEWRRGTTSCTGDKQRHSSTYRGYPKDMGGGELLCGCADDLRYKICDRVGNCAQNY